MTDLRCTENQLRRGAIVKKGLIRLIGLDELRPALLARAATARALALVRSSGARVLVDEAVEALLT